MSHLSTAIAQGQNALEGLAVSQSQSGRTILKLTFKEQLASVPASFNINNPPRIALDFPGMANASGKNSQDIGDPNLRSVNLVQAGNRVRVVLNLNRQLGIESQIDGKDLLLTLVETGGSTASAPVVSRFSESKGVDAGHSIRDVDFRRGKNGEGRILVDLSDPSTGIDIRQQGKNLIVDFLKTSLPRNLERRMDVTDFATPVTLVDVFAQGGNTRIVIEPKGLWEHSAYQTDNKFILEVKPIQEDPNKLIQGSKQGYKGDRLSLNFQNVEVRSVLQVIADFTGLNIITSDTVGGNLTLRLKDVPWDQALDIILQTKGLDMRKNGNVVWIAPREELATKEKLELEQRQQITDLEPLQTEMFQLNYQKASAVEKILQAQGVLSKRGSVVTDARTNLLMVQETAARLDAIRSLIQRIDITVRQVLIEARIVVADDKFSRQLGSRFGNQGGFRVGNNNIGTSGQPGNANTFALGLSPNQTLRPIVGEDFNLRYGTNALPYNVNLPVPSAAGALALTFLNLGSGNLINVELSALEASNRGKVISNPRVITSDNQKSVIEQGTEIPYIVPASSASSLPAINFKKAVLSLSVTPQITPDNRIIMTLEVRKDAVGQLVKVAAGSGSVEVPSIDTKNVVTQISVNNGETAVIGGIYEEITRDDEKKVPLLGDLPIVGNLFKNKSRQADKTELLIFITPRILKDSIGNAVQ